MSTAEPRPASTLSLIPHLCCAGAADAIDFYRRAFGAVELMRMPGPQGKLMHAEMQIGQARFMLADEFPEWGNLGPKSLKGSPVTVHFYVDDVDTVFQTAVNAGATVRMAPQDMFWGDRYGALEDPYGHLWSIATHVRDVSPEEMQQGAAAAMCGPGAG